MASFWISYSDPEKPVGSQLQGVVVIEAEDEDAALESAKAKGLAAGSKITVEDISHRNPPPDWFDRLLSGKESRDLNRLLCKMAQAEDDD